MRISVDYTIKEIKMDKITKKWSRIFGKKLTTTLNFAPGYRAPKDYYRAYEAFIDLEGNAFRLVELDGEGARAVSYTRNIFEVKAFLRKAYKDRTWK